MEVMWTLDAAHSADEASPPPGVDLQQQQQEIDEFMRTFRAWNARNVQPKPEPQSILNGRLLPQRVAETLPPEDQRFHPDKKQRVFICDGCGDRVIFSSRLKRSWYQRSQCDGFAGSFLDRTWDDIPGPLRGMAWDMRLIDATWHCHYYCKADMTWGQTQARNHRTAAYTQTCRQRIEQPAAKRSRRSR